MKRIAARYLYTLDGTLSPIHNGYVEVSDDGEILSVGEVKDPSKEKVFVDGALTPGFVNAHCHVELSYMKGLFRKGTGMTGFIDQINALRDTKPLQEKIDDIRHWMDTMYSRGVQAMADISNCDDSFAIKQTHPMYTRTFLEVFGSEKDDCAPVMKSVRALAQRARSFGLDAAPTPHAIYTMHPSLVEASSAEGLKSGFLSYHSEESPEEEDMVMYGKGPMWQNRKDAGMSVPPVTGGTSLEYFIDRIRAAHPAEVTEHVLLVHEVCLTEKGAQEIKEFFRNPFIAVCPLSNIYIHSMLPPIPIMRKSGIPIAIGTDSLSSNDDLDMVGEMYCLQSSFPEVPLGEILSWACTNGARFLAKDDVFGSIRKGKKPGLVAIEGLSEDGNLTRESKSRRLV